jgi:hypothetical protein
MFTRLRTKSIRTILFAFGMAALALGMLATAGTPAHSAPQLHGAIKGHIPDPRDHRFERGLPPRERQKGGDDWDRPQRVPMDQLIERGKGSEAITYGNWTNISPPLTAIDAVSSTDAWAIVENVDGSLLHYTGGSWQSASVGNSWYLDDIDMTSSTSGWIAAYYPGALEYDGTNWTAHDAGDFGLYSVSVVGEDDVWFVGQDYSANYIPVIAHWNGTSFVSAGPSLPSSTYLYDINMASSNEGWAVGDDYNSQTGVETPVLLRYDGATWSPVPPPMSTGYLSKVASTGPGVMWATGVDDTDFYPRVYRYDGGVWTSWIVDYGTDFTMLNASEGYLASYESIWRWDGSIWTQELTGEQFFGVSGVSGQVWAVGGGELIMSRTGAGSWEKQHGGPTSNTLYGVSSLGVDDVWAVGASTNGPQGTTIVHYSAGAWQPVTNTLTDNLYDVQMLSATEGYAVGDSTIAKWNGTNWARVAQPNASMLGLFMTGPGQGWAVGSGGKIWRATGGTWLQVSSPVTASLSAVAMDSPSHGWAVGYSYTGSSYEGTLLEYDGSSWVNRSNLVPSGIVFLNDIVLDGAGNGWAVGASYGSNSYGVMRLSNGVWSADTDTVYTYLDSVATEALGEAWAVGCSTMHYVGGSWQYDYIPTSWCQNGISLLPGRGGWVVGPYGTILKYDPLMDGRRYYDVPTDNTFYSYIECMATRGIISGYADNTFHPNSNITRGQLSKVVSNSAGFSDPPGAQIFEDVPPGNSFYDWVQRLASRGFIGGYPCGGVGEPCGVGNRPYFRPNNDTTRAQITKIVSNTAGFVDPPGAQLFEDVPPTHGFYQWVQRLASRGIMGGYLCGGEGEPCGTNNLPYFRPNNNATRGQVSKIVTNTFFPNCQNQ